MLKLTSPLLLIQIGLVAYMAISDGVDINDPTWILILFGAIPLLAFALGITAWELHQRDKKQAQSES